MNVEFVLGNRKSGKSLYMSKILKKHIDSKEICYFLVPEQITLETENKLISSLNYKGLLDIQVISFKKLGNLLLKNSDLRTKIFLNEQGQLLILNKAINDLDSELKFFRKAKASTLEEINKVISDMRDVDLSPIHHYENIENKDLKSKLKEIEMINNKYQEYLEDGYIDEINFNLKLIEAISASDSINKAHVFIDDFFTFSNQQLKIIKELIISAKTFTIGLNIDINNPEFNQLGQNIYKNLHDFTKAKNINIKNTILNYQFFESKELEHLENIISNNKMVKYPESTKDLTILSFNNIDEEVKNIFESIIRLSDQGISYRDIKIVCNNIDDYRNYFKLYRKLYEVPLFIDEKLYIHNHPIARAIISIIQLLDDIRTEDVIVLLKTNYLDFEIDEIEKLEKYANENGINYYKWTKVFSDNPEIETIREKVYNIIKFIRETVNGTTVREKIISIYKIISYFKIYEKLSANIEIYKENENFKNVYINTQFWNTLLEILDQLVSFLGENTISNNELLQLFKNSLEREFISILPVNNNEVMVINSQDAFKESAKIVFVIGANEGYLPEKISHEALFPLDETIILEKVLNWKKDDLSKQLNRNMELYFTLSMASKNLIITYSLSDSKGEGLKPAYIIRVIKKVFNLSKTQESALSDDSYFYSKNISLLNFLKLENKKEIKISEKMYKNIFSNFGDFLNTLYQYNKNETIEGEIDSDIVKKILFDSKEPFFTISKLEEYGKCPYSFFIKYCINPNEDLEYELKPMDIGNIYHHVLEKIGEKNWYLEKKENPKNIIEEHFEKEYLENNFLKFDNYQFTYRLNKIKEEGIKLVDTLRNDIINSEFKPSYYEVEFGPEKTFPEYRLFLDSKESIFLIGKVDRVDILNTINKDYLRVIDYKLRGKKIDYRKVRDGIMFQLFVYLNALSSEKYQPSGVIYSQLIDEYKKNRLTGLIIKDEKQEFSLPNDFKESSIINNLEFDLIKRFTEDKIKDHAKNIINGNFKVNPYYYKNDEKGCKYCKYLKICKNKNKNRVLENGKYGKNNFIEELNKKYAKLD
ncbi:MAG: PD-(D/E)XK nuclease family protein [Firmicutes bacterium]|nr:PD-(D/E)XK nuclease family protein [Bacillota bacterium]